LDLACLRATPCPARSLLPRPAPRDIDRRILLRIVDHTAQQEICPGEKGLATTALSQVEDPRDVVIGGLGLGFTLLSDEDHAVAEAYDVWQEKSMYGKKYMGILRSAFLVDEKGTIAEAWYKVSPKDTTANLLKALEQS